MPPRSCSVIANFCAPGSSDDETQRADEHREGCDLRHLQLVGGRTFGMDVFAIDVAREEIGAGDGHDGGGHQRADDDRGEGHAHEPRREHLQEQCRHGIVGAEQFELMRIGRHRLHAAGQRHRCPAARSIPAPANRPEGSRRCGARHACWPRRTIQSPHADRGTAPAPNPAPASHSRSLAPDCSPSAA